VNQAVALPDFEIGGAAGSQGADACDGVGVFCRLDIVGREHGPVGAAVMDPV
jgi:hypothetical protein